MREFFQQFKGHEHTPLVQFIKYGIAGAIATVVDAVIFFYCAWKILPALGANDPLPRFLHLAVTQVAEDVRDNNATLCRLIAFIFSNITAYLLNIKFVFEGGRHHRMVEIGMFYAVSGISLFVSTILMWALIHWFFTPTSYAYLVNILVSLAINYALRKFVVFKG